MELLKLDEIKKLKSNESDICISILIPTHRAGKETNNGTDSLTFKSQLQLVTNCLEKDYEYTHQQTEKLLAPAKALLEDSSFWRKQSDGLAVYISEGFFKYFTLPISFESSYYVMKEFMIAPITGLLNKDDHFFILQLSKDNVHLYDATRFSIRPIDLTHLELPKDYSEIIDMKNPDRTLQQHAGKRGQDSIFHGQGASKDAEDNKLSLLFRTINKELQKVLLNENRPLLMAGVSSVVGEFKKHLHYNSLLSESISGNYDHEEPMMLHERAMVIMSPILKEKKLDLLRNFDDHAASPIISTDFKDIVEGAIYEKVDTLFFKTKACPTWGKLNGNPASVEVHENYEKGDICLLNKAVVDSLVNQGTVYQLISADEPDMDHSLAARFRF